MASPGDGTRSATAAAGIEAFAGQSSHPDRRDTGDVVIYGLPDPGPEGLTDGKIRVKNS